MKPGADHRFGLFGFWGAFNLLLRLFLFSENLSLFFKALSKHCDSALLSAAE